MTLFIIVVLIGIVAIIISSRANNKKSEQTIEEQKIEERPATDPKPAMPSFAQIMEEEMAKDKPKKKRETLRYFCTSDNGYGYITVWPKDQMIPDYLEFDIAGTNYRKGLMKYTGEFKGRLEEER